MRRLVIGGLVAAVGTLSMACAQAIKTVVTTPGTSTTLTLHRMSLEFHDATFGGCKPREKPGRIQAKRGDVVLWEITNKCGYNIDVCLGGFLPETKDALSPDPLEDVDEQNRPQTKRRCDHIQDTATGKIRTRVRSEAVYDEYEYSILRRKRQREWKTVDPMIDIVP
jgi:hypothetical protein